MADLMQTIIDDPRPFTDPDHPIHQHDSVREHPDDYALPAKPELQSMTVDGLTIRQLDAWVIEVAGVKMTAEAIRQALLCQSPDRLFAFRRDDETIRVRSFVNANSANEFFARGWES